ncbi:hypothetical protein GCM10025778_11230 [Paeniglutamicibacter antarcticus]|uniref:Uncharacterized protein n=1 Tax=Paeniglutamicibacter antarcticus TaxID=494023 RepID=A0ABP9TK84_9MICC
MLRSGEGWFIEGVCASWIRKNCTDEMDSYINSLGGQPCTYCGTFGALTNIHQ